MTDNNNTAPVTIMEIPAEPILMHRDQARINLFQTFATDATKRLTACLESFRALGLGEITLEEINTLYRGKDTVENFVRERVTGGETQKVGKMVFSAEMVKALVVVPDF